jgi:alanyl-tRNA synthetase
MLLDLCADAVRASCLQQVAVVGAVALTAAGPFDPALQFRGSESALQLEGADAGALRSAVDQLKDKLENAVVVLGAVDGDKVRLVAGVSKSATDRIKAGELVSAVARKVGGRGGGRPDMAQAGGTDPDALPDALDGVYDWINSQIATNR